MKHRIIRLTAALATVATLAACAVSSDIMETENGTYTITGIASPMRGSAAGAASIIQADARKFCATQGKRAVAVTSEHRDIQNSTMVINRYGGFGGTSTAGGADLQFRCV